MSGDDRDLRGLFRELRREDHRSAPPFRASWNDARRRSLARVPRRVVRPLVWTAATIAAAALVVLWIVPGDGVGSLDAEIALAREISEWEAPTNAFVEISGVGFLDGVPSLEFTAFELPEVSAPETEEIENGC